MNKLIDVTTYLRNLSEDDFRDLGTGQVAYIRKVSGDEIPVNGITFDKLETLDTDEDSYVVCAADGTPLSQVDDYDAAVQMLQYQGVKQATTH